MRRIDRLLLFTFIVGGCAPRPEAVIVTWPAPPPPPLESAPGVVAITPAQASTARESYVDGLNVNRDRKSNEKTARNSYYTVAVTGIIAGVVGGIYGLSTDNETAKTASSVTSLLSGGLSAVIATFGLDSRTRKRENCIKIIDNRITHMNSLWSEASFQAVAENGEVPIEFWTSYREDVKKSNELITSLDCD